MAPAETPTRARFAQNARLLEVPVAPRVAARALHTWVQRNLEAAATLRYLAGEGVSVAVLVILAICVAASSHRRGSEVNWYIPTNEAGRGQPRRNQTEEDLS